ncbi:MAG: hypothetical protein WD824_05445 [Cyclobacteriaceae bacterium]
MKLRSLLFILFTAITIPVLSQSSLGAGEQPQITVDSRDVVRLVYGNGNRIYFSTSTDKGETFSTPEVVGAVDEMHLGMTRGPQLATSRDYSIVTAMDKKGNIHSFKLSHKTGKWEKIEIVNDVDASAPEGLMAVTADDNNNFYAVWLDLREGRKNNICFATLDKNSAWSKNRFGYKSPESHVCECCKPSIAVRGNNVSIMFRNWLKGSRDMYLITSSNGGKTFSKAQKLGLGTWPLKGCPMDGGGLSIDSENNVRTAWQREGIVYFAEPGKPEERIGEGRSVGMNGNLVNWQKGSDLILQRINGEQQKIGEGTSLKVIEFKDRAILVIWENEDEILFRKI